MVVYKRLGGIVCFVVAVSASGAVLAQDAQQCTCLLPVTEGGVAVGELSAVRGDVMMSQPTGYSAAPEGTSIVSGARIVVGANSSASLSFGQSCPLMVTAGSTVRVDRLQAGVCVSVDRPAVDRAAVQEDAPAAGAANGTVLGIALGAAAVAGGVALIVGSDDGDAVSN